MLCKTYLICHPSPQHLTKNSQQPYTTVQRYGKKPRISFSLYTYISDEIPLLSLWILFNELGIEAITCWYCKFPGEATVQMLYLLSLLLLLCKLYFKSIQYYMTLSSHCISIIFATVQIVGQLHFIPALAKNKN